MNSYGFKWVLKNIFLSTWSCRCYQLWTFYSLRISTFSKRCKYLTTARGWKKNLENAMSVGCRKGRRMVGGGNRQKRPWTLVLLWSLFGRKEEPSFHSLLHHSDMLRGSLKGSHKEGGREKWEMYTYVEYRGGIDPRCRCDPSTSCCLGSIHPFNFPPRGSNDRV